MTFSPSRYPTLSMQFDPKFVTHDDKAEIPVESYVISQDPTAPGCPEHSAAIASILAAFHPQFPVA